MISTEAKFVDYAQEKCSNKIYVHRKTRNKYGHDYEMKRLIAFGPNCWNNRQIT